MNKTKYLSLLNGALLMVGVLTGVSCSDEWNEHYLPQDKSMEGAPSLLENIKSDPDLANFAKVLEATGYAQRLNNPAMFTVFAPKGLTDLEAEYLINQYRSESVKDEDRQTVKQFIKNHIALYARNLFKADYTVYTNNDIYRNGDTGFFVDTISMANGKYMRLMPASATELYIGPNSNASSVVSNKILNKVVSNNGFLYKIEGEKLDFFHNVREKGIEDARLDSVSGYLCENDEFVLDEEKSVAGEVIDGKTHYLDSVTVFKNYEYETFRAYLEREDSTYLFLAPTNEVWEKEYEEYSKYFNYQVNRQTQQMDGNQRQNTARAILKGRFFNRNSRYNRNPNDSLCSTNYSVYQKYQPYDDRRASVFYNPYAANGIMNFSNPEDTIVCSNGLIAIDREGRIDKRKTFFRNEVQNAHSGYSIPQITQGTSKKNAFEFKALNEAYHDSLPSFTPVYRPEMPEGHQVSLVSNGKKVYDVNYYSRLYSSNDKMPYIDYPLTGLMSNVYYNIYVVTVPADIDGKSYESNTSMYPGAMVFDACIFEKSKQEEVDKVYDTEDYDYCLDIVHPYENVPFNGLKSDTLGNHYFPVRPTDFATVGVDGTVTPNDPNIPPFSAIGSNKNHFPAVDEVDYIQIASAYKFEYAGLGANTVPYVLRLRGEGRNTRAFNDFTYDDMYAFQSDYYRTDLRIEKIIFVPFDNSDEASSQTMLFGTPEGKKRVINDYLK